MFVFASPVFAEGKGRVESAATRTEDQLSAFKGRIKPVIEAELEADVKSTLSLSLIEAAGPEQRSKVQRKLLQSLLQLRPSLSLVSSCEVNSCQQHDIENELLHIASVARVAAEFLRIEELATQRASFVQIGELLAKAMKSHPLKPIDQSRVLIAILRISDRLPSEISLDPMYLKRASGLAEEADITTGTYVLEALLALYQSSADGQWLLLAERVADRLVLNIGEQSDKNDISTTINRLARHALSLFYYTGAEQYRDFASRVSSRELSRLDNLSTEALLDAFVLQSRLQSKPFHVTIVAPKEDLTAMSLFNLARGVPVAFRRLEWWDPGQGKLQNPDVRYPVLKRPAAFICVEQRCSLPLFSEQDIQRSLAKIFN